jgi:peptidoglycan/xylan/chitin deacetylase (PgdA/CDA1 family)
MVSFLRRCWARRRAVAESVLCWSGLGAAYEAIAKPTGAVVLKYHSVAAPAVEPFVDPENLVPSAMFRRQMEFVQRNRRVVPLATIVDDVVAGRTPPAGTVAITFDDGYLDNLEVAAPILAELGLPATLFLATAYVATAEPQWADRLHVAFARRTRHRLQLPDLAIDADLRRPDEAAAARQALHRHLLEALTPARAATLRAVDDALVPALGDAPRLGLTWHEVRRLQADFPSWDFGGHTRGHVDLRTHQGDVAAAEIAGCAADVERELGVRPRLFSFPYGRWTPATRELVRANGFAGAVGDTDAVRVGASSDPYVLPRLDTPQSMTAVRYQTSGANPGALALLRRRRR